MQVVCVTMHSYLRTKILSAILLLSTMTGAMLYAQQHAESIEGFVIQKIVVVPLLASLPTLSTIFAQNLQKTISLQVQDKAEITSVFGDKEGFDQLASLLYKYLLDLDYDVVIFTSVSDTANTVEDDSVIQVSVEDAQYTVNIRMFSKGNTKGVYNKQYMSTLKELSTGTRITEQSEKTVEEFSTLIDVVEASIETVSYITLAIVPASTKDALEIASPEETPEYLLKVHKEQVLLFDHAQGIAYLPKTRQQVSVYQILQEKELLVKKTTVTPKRKHTQTESISIEVEFIDPKLVNRFAKDHISIDILSGYSFPLHTNAEASIFYPAVTVASKIQYHGKLMYIGVKFQYTALSILDTEETVIDNRYGVFMSTGVNVNFAKRFEFTTGFNIGTLLLNTSSNAEFNYIPRVPTPAAGLELGLNLHIFSNYYGSMRIITELVVLSSYYMGQEDISNIAIYIAGQANVGIGWRF